MWPRTGDVTVDADAHEVALAMYQTGLVYRDDTVRDDLSPRLGLVPAVPVVDRSEVIFWTIVCPSLLYQLEMSAALPKTTLEVIKVAAKIVRTGTL